MINKIWVSEVEVYFSGNCRWITYTFRVIATTFKNALPKIYAAVNRAGFRHNRKRINSVTYLGDID